MSTEDTLSLYDDSNLTRRQLLMWIGQKMNPHVPDLNMANLWRVAGPIDAACFASAVRRLVGEADVLRTVIVEHEGIPMQHMREDEPPLALEVVDLRDGARNDERLAEDAQARAARVLDIRTCLYDFALYLLPQGESAIYFNLHHIAGDGWTLTLLFRRLSELYAEEEAGTPASPSPFRPFTEYLPVERAYSASPTCQEDQRWWAAHVGTGSESLRAYGHLVRGESGAAERVSEALGAARTERLRAVAGSAEFGGKNIHATMQNMLCATLCAWLHHVGPNDSVTIGLPFHNRTDEFRSTAGLFMQVLPVHVRVESGETFRSLYKKVAATVAEGLRHRRCTVENPLRQRVCDVIMNYLVTEYGDFAGHSVAYDWVFSRHTNVALSVQIHDFLCTGILHIDMDMQCNAFPASRRQRVADHLLRVLDAVLEDPDRPLADIEVMRAEDREAVISLGRGPVSVVRPLDPRVRDDATRVALICGDRRMTGAELAADVDRLARRLRQAGLGPNDRAAIYLERSTEMLTAILAVLRAGAGYVPLDPSHPDERTRWMLEDSAPRVIVTQQSLAARLAPSDVPVIRVDEVGDAVVDLPQDAADDELAYVIYTSGSTGQPKGVEISRRALASFLDAVERTGWLDARDTLLAVSPLSFDFHVPQLHLPLRVGARIVLAEADEVTDPRRLMALIKRHGVTAMAATPTMWRMLLEAGWEGCRDLKVHCGGEALPADLARQLRARVAQLWNVYGPTETTVYAAIHRVELDDEGVSVGRPLDNMTLFVVDPRGRLAAPGAIGELWIGGVGLARGYLNRPQLTAEKFVESEWGRVYRSGDLARWLPNGTLEVLGRVDHQVKIRGHRVELGEIEATLELHPKIAQAVVTLQAAHAEAYLAAFVVARSAIGLEEVRHFLQQRLPSYMVPSRWQFIDQLPLSVHGKIDRQALVLAPQSPTQTAPARPLDLLEYQVLRIFEDVLRLENLSADADFFAHGGSSLLAVRTLTRIERVLGRSLPVQALFDAPTAARLADALRRDGWTPSLDTLVPIQTRGDVSPFFCVHTFIGDLCRGLHRHFGVGRPFYGLQPRGLDGRETPLTSVEEMASHYLAEIRRVQPAGPYHIGGYCFGGVVAFEMAQQLRAAGEEVALLVIIDAALSANADGSVKSRLAGGLRMLGKAFDALRAPDRVDRVRKYITRAGVRRAIQANAAEVDVSGLLDGIDQWPAAYQRMAQVHYAALIRYKARPYDGVVTYIRSADDGQRWSLEKESRGWRGLCREVVVHRVEAAHLQIVEEPHVREVAAVIHAAMPAPHRVHLSAS